MRFELDEEHALLKQSVRDFLAKEAALDQMRPVMEENPEGYPPALYRQIAELGYPGVWLPESRGGAEMGHVGLAVVLHEMGRSALPGPFLDLVIAAELLYQASGDDAAHALAGLLAGDTIAVVAHAENAAGRSSDPLHTRGSGGRVLGRKRFVPFGASADGLVVTTREGIAWVARPADGWNATALRSLDHAQRLVDLDLDHAAALVAEGDAARRAWARAQQLGAFGAAAWLLGGMERALEITLDYLKERQAFGVPIGSFQALQHRAADMMLRTESSRAAVYRAAWALDAAPDEAPLLVATAKAYAGEAARYVCGQAIQLHGGVGFTWEYDPHLFFKRTKTLEQFYGVTGDQLEAVLQARGL